MSKLNEMQVRFQQKQIQDREDKLMKLYENKQQLVIQRVSKNSSSSSVSYQSGVGKVRQMFDERRQKAGIDKSYPLEPIKQKPASVVSNTPVHKTTTDSILNRTTKRTPQNLRAPLQRNVPQTGKTQLSQLTKKPVESTYINNDKEIRGNSIAEHTLDILRNEEKQLEELMQNHKIDDDTNELQTRKQKPVKRDATITKPRNSVEAVKKNINGTDRTLQNKPSETRSTTVKDNKFQMKSANTRRSTATNPKPQPTRSAVSPRVHSSVNRDDLKPCSYCNRRFAADRIQLHEEICARTLKKRRKIYDPVKHRVQGTEAETYVRRGAKTTSSKPKPHQIGKSDWRRQHEEFIAAIRAAKQAQAHVARGGKLTDLPPPPPSFNPDYIQCPHCGRRFNEAAAARHIPKCATMLHNKPNRPGLQPKKKF